MFRMETSFTSIAQAYLESIGCTRTILHAPPSEKPFYYSLGFSKSNEVKSKVIKYTFDL
jgi:1,6-anhydro-N-acetylmuramate kinase